MKPHEGKREDWVKLQVKKIFAKHGVWFYMPSAAIYGRAGASDFIACAFGRMLAVETKADRTSKPTPLQYKFMSDVIQAGGVAMVVHRGNLEEFEAWLATLLETWK